MSVRERLAFWRGFRSHVATTGALQPSSRFLAKAMTAPLRRLVSATERPLRVVEMGPGTGSITRAIATALRPGDTLDCYEINARFADYLRERIAEDPAFEHLRPTLQVHHGAAQDVRPTRTVDAVLCSVPLNNLEGALVDSILDAGHTALRDDGWLSYFEYLLLPTIRRAAARAGERDRIDEVRAAKKRWDRYRRDAEIVLRNVPPARAVHLQRVDSAT